MDGFININKPKDFTSHDVVNVIKRNFRGQKIGHGGTLDPAATGVLPICIGKGTKLQSYVMGQTKVYRSVLFFGCDSPSLDADGGYTLSDPHFLLEETKLKGVLQGFCGKIQQIPPMVSAIKKQGVPLYKLAKKGVEVELAPREVEIESIALLKVEEGAPSKATIEVTCSKGTYIRSLARDIGAAMGTQAIVGELCRIATGDFSLAKSFTMEEVAAMAEKKDFSFVLPMETVLTHLPQVVLKDMKEIRRVLAGNTINAAVLGDTVRISDGNGVLLALGERTEEGLIKPFKILYGNQSKKSSMSLWHSLAEVEVADTHTAVALGNFDGVHLGHQYLMEQLVRKGEQKGLKTVIATFSPHPRDYFCKGCHKYLQTKGDKIKHINKIGADALLFIDFHQALAEMTPEDFVEKILLETLHASMVLVGYNFKFGKKAEGNAPWLKAYGGKRGIEVEIVEEITYGQETVSSSAIKKYLQAGDMEKANGLLGYAYQCHGEVVYGNQLGRTIGFPTANVAVSDSVILPAKGIYITWATYGGKRHPSVTNIGSRPTIGENLAVTVEVNILDDAPQLYGENIEVTFLSRIRSEEKFDSLEALKEQIAKDAENARNFFLRRSKK